MKRWLVLIAIGVVVGVWMGIDKKERDSHPYVPLPESPAPAVHVAAAPRAAAQVSGPGSLVAFAAADPDGERAPVFADPKDAKTAARELAAMHFVYDACSKFFVFREGSKLSSDTVPALRANSAGLVNVRVEVADSRKVNGDVLWYRVDLDARGEPSTLLATKTSASEACKVPNENHPDEFDVSEVMRPVLPKYVGGDACDGNKWSQGGIRRSQLAAAAAAGPGFAFDGSEGIGILSDGCDETVLRIDTKQCNAKSLAATVAPAKEMLASYGFRSVRCGDDGPRVSLMPGGDVARANPARAPSQFADFIEAEPRKQPAVAVPHHEAQQAQPEQPAAPSQVPASPSKLADPFADP